MHSRRVLSFFFANRTGAPYGEVLGLMNPLSNSSCSWTLSSCNSTGAILCRVIEMGEVPECNSIPKSTTLCGGNPGNSSGKTSSYSQTTQGRSKSGLTSSSKVRLASQPPTVYDTWTRTLFWVKYHACLLKYNTSTVLRVGGNPPTLTIDNKPVSCQPIHPQDDVEL